MKTIWLAVMLAGCGGGAFEDASPSQAQDRGGSAGHIGKIGGIEPVMGVGGAGSGGSTTLPGGAGGTPAAAGMAGASGAGQAGGGMAGSLTAGGAGAPGGLGGAPAKGGEGGVAGSDSTQGGTAGLGGSPAAGSAGAGGETAPTCSMFGTYALTGALASGFCGGDFAYDLKQQTDPAWIVTFHGADVASFQGWKNSGDGTDGTYFRQTSQVDGCHLSDTYTFHAKDGVINVSMNLTFGAENVTGLVTFYWSVTEPDVHCDLGYTVTGTPG